MKRFRSKRFTKRSRRGGKRSMTSYYRRLNARILRAVSERSHRNAQGTVIATTQAQSAFPIRHTIPYTYFDAGYLTAVLDDTGVGGTPLGSSTSTNGRYSLYGLRAFHTFRNVALNPVMLDVWVLTPKSGTGYKSTTDANYDSMNEQIMADIYSGWQAKYLAADLTASVKQSDATTAWAGTGDFYCNSMNFTPSASNDFRRRWAIKKHYKVNLQPGQSFVFQDKAKPLFGWLPAEDLATKTLGRAGTARSLLVRVKGAPGYNGTSQGYCVANVVYQGNFYVKVCNEVINNSYVSATIPASLPAAAAVSGVGDDSVVA